MHEASHESMGTLTVQSGVHPEIGELVVVASRDGESVPIHTAGHHEHDNR